MHDRTDAQIYAGEIWEDTKLLPRARRTHFSLIVRAGCLFTILLLICLTPLKAQTRRGNVICNEEVSAKRRHELENKLQKITGWSDLAFNRDGILQIGNRQWSGGSKSARELIAKAIDGQNVVVVEDASKRSDVVFCQVIKGVWKGNATASRPVYVVLIDFFDFEHLIGDQRALSSFDVGWGFLHELDHVVNDSSDPGSARETGECETHINRMRQECDVPQRADYFYSSSPVANDNSSVVRLVRLAFVEEDAAVSKKKRYWLLWDANLVGSTDERKQFARVEIEPPN